MDLIAISCHLKGGPREDGAKLFSETCSDKTIRNGHNLKQSKVWLSVRERKQFCSGRPWNRSPYLSRRLVYMRAGGPFQSNFFYESLILPCVESCSEEELAAFELLKTIFPWVALPQACCCYCYCQRRNKGVGVVAFMRTGSSQQI